MQRPWVLDVTGPANGTYAAAGRGAVSSRAAGSLRISGLLDAEPTDTLQGYAFNVSYIVHSPSQVCPFPLLPMHCPDWQYHAAVPLTSWRGDGQLLCMHFLPCRMPSPPQSA